MGDWKEATKALTESIKDSEEYVEYQRAREVVVGNPDWNRMLDDYRRESFTVHLTDKANWLGNYEQLKGKHENALGVMEIKRFLMAEMKLCRLYRAVWETICEEGGMDLGFLDAL